MPDAKKRILATLNQAFSDQPRDFPAKKNSEIPIFKDSKTSRISSEKPDTIKQAATSIILCDTPQIKNDFSVIFIKRVRRNSDPWSGQMAFPGGKKDFSDNSLLDTAIRETNEEIGLSLSKNHCLGNLEPIQARHKLGLIPLFITPYVFSITDDSFPGGLNADQLNKFKQLDEVENVFSIPLQELLNEENRSVRKYQRGEKNGAPEMIELPCIKYNSLEIWGLTLMMIENLKKIL